MGARPASPRAGSGRTAALIGPDQRFARTWKNTGVKLLVAALDAELVAFPAALPGFDRLVTGPGKLKAAYALTRALDAADYDEVVVVGTAGAIDERLDGTVYEIDAAIQHDVTDLDGVVGQHVSLPPRVESGREGVTIATGDHFVDDAEAVRVILPLGAGLVDMETYAYIWVADQFGVPIRVLKSVSDRAQDDAITDWRTTVAACSEQLRERIREEYGV
jgi:adenosylhomocysteine nucleosidase